MIRDRWRVLFVLLLVVHLAPVWIFRFFPSQDGPSHLYNARLLTEMLEPANFQVRLFFEYSAALHPNLLAHVLLAALQLVVSPLVAEKLLLSLIVALFPLSLAYLLDGIRRGHVVFACSASSMSTTASCTRDSTGSTWEWRWDSSQWASGGATGPR